MNGLLPSHRVAIFLGAGASKAFGLPLTAEILPLINTRLNAKTLFKGRNGQRLRDQLSQFLSDIMPGITLIDQQHVLITELLSLIDYMLLSDYVPSPREQTKQLHTTRMLLERGLLEVLEWPHDPSNEHAVPVELRKLAQWMFDVGNSSAISLISTNYDEVVETELYRRFLPSAGCERPFDNVNQLINFGVSWRDCPSGKVFHPPANARHSVLKLHGSIDWMKCDLCGWIICNDTLTFQKMYYHLSSYTKQTEHNTCDCGHWPLRPVIVAPSLVRDTRDTNILSIWKTAFEQMRVADYWYIIGYSFPIEDYAIRTMLIRAIKSRKNAPHIVVYQLGNNIGTESRYRAFFGGNCEYKTTGMSGFISDVVDVK